MKFKLPILDLSGVSDHEQYQKIIEEFKEFCAEVEAGWELLSIRELLDLIQASIGYIQNVYTREEIENAIE